jgi:hypothetical protein
MIIPLVALVAVAQPSAVEVWTGGDDGLTQRFANAVRAATAKQQVTTPFKPIRALVEQVIPISEMQYSFIVTFSYKGRAIGITRCIGNESDIPRCATRAADSARAYLAKSR